MLQQHICVAVGVGGFAQGNSRKSDWTLPGRAQDSDERVFEGGVRKELSWAIGAGGKFTQEIEEEALKTYWALES